MSKKLIITGGCGFLGSNVSNLAIQAGYSVHVFDNLSRAGSIENLVWLRNNGLKNFVHGDIRVASDIQHLIKTVKPDAIFHLAGQVAMTTSICDPHNDFQVNAQGTLNVLESVRSHSPDSMLVFSSTNKVYGDLSQYNYDESLTRYICGDRPMGFDESEPLMFHSPYGCSKGAADQYCLDYARIFGLNSLVLRHSSIYGGRQYSNEGQGWVGWFVDLAVRGDAKKAITVSISGNGKQVRDILHARDAAALYMKCLAMPSRVVGRAFNVGGGVENSLSLIELFGLIESICGVKIKVERGPARLSDQRVFISNNSNIKAAIQWEPLVSARQGIDEMIQWRRSQLGISPIV